MTTRDWAPIQYRDFWDVPRVFVVSIEGEVYLFDCPWNPGAEDYEHYYRVALLPMNYVAPMGSWIGIEAKAVSRLTDIAISDVRFDESRRAAVSISALRPLLRKSADS